MVSHNELWDAFQESAIVLSCPEQIMLVHRFFEQDYDAGKPFISVRGNQEKGQEKRSEQKPVFLLQESPLPGRWLSGEELSGLLTQKGKDHFKKQENNERMKYAAYVTKRGLTEFFRTGRVLGKLSEYMHSCSVSLRRKILLAMMEEKRQDTSALQILEEHKFTPGAGCSVFCVNELENLIFAKCADGREIAVVWEERGMSIWLYRFMTQLKNCGFCMEEEAQMDFLEKLERML